MRGSLNKNMRIPHPGRSSLLSYTPISFGPRPIPASVRLQDYAASCMTVQVLAPRAPWSRRCFDNPLWFLRVSRIISMVRTPFEQSSLASSVQGVSPEETKKVKPHLNLMARNLMSRERSQFEPRTAERTIENFLLIALSLYTLHPSFDPTTA